MTVGTKNIANEEATGDPDMIVESGTVSGSNSFASVYQNLKGALLHVDNGAHALIVTDVNGPARSQILICSHTADRKAIAISDFWNSGLIQMQISCLRTETSSEIPAVIRQE